MFEPLHSLLNFQPFIKKRLSSLVGDRCIDLLLHFPTHTLQRQKISSFSETSSGQLVTFVAKVTSTPQRSFPPFRFYLQMDDGDGLEVVFFNGRSGYWKQKLPLGQNVGVSGKITRFNKEFQMSHPDWIGAPKDVGFWCGSEPVYPLTAGVTNPVIRSAIRQAIARLTPLPEWIPTSLREQRHWPSWQQAILTLHHGQDKPREEITRAWERVAFDELLTHQLSLRVFKKKQEHVDIQPWAPVDPNSFMENLPFSLTSQQDKALQDLLRDFQSSSPCVRLLQGDVGSGKTMVAFLGLLCAVSNGFHGVLLAPTEILAGQHFQSFEKFFGHLNISCALLTGATKTKDKKKIKEDLARGKISIVIGTHALLEDDVTFDNLGFVVVDEQHRFGVLQRQSLAQKGSPHVLIMTATPIPRTLLLSSYGDLSVSRLTEKPKGRPPIPTRLISLEKIEDVIFGLKRAIETGEKAYWICPLVEASETLDLTAATQRFEVLREILGPCVGLVHGKTPAAEKDALIDSFRTGQLSVLVATTVVEVGIDVPDATIILIEHAERFGLAQLHQLRGRVGRGHQPSQCLLLYGQPLGGIAHQRLEIMRQTEDGFVIAEKDLQLRGAGDVAGTQQSGAVTYRFQEEDIPPLFLLEDANSLANRMMSLWEDKTTREHVEYLFRIYKPAFLSLLGGSLEEAQISSVFN